ncbi:hypothetical protein GGD81_000157 [Rhodobium orientis]|uniref:Uncharacterized protein n=1 Tax=Rhodobium orientis TaxID=34017 RepID=A0A327JWY6_9HYPH|nr:hypothetical protein [Rhodobium orientis]MBB4301142.1 hypothetical protein [Rhodobium orientis]MBK5949806.1 hypothetical protein [Rhodobium orientis]RAI30084.1 hypothetical protein CH339_00705 [Rhodobium orientis]
MTDGETSKPPPLYTKKEFVEQSAILFPALNLIAPLWVYKYDEAPTNVGNSQFFYFQLAALALSIVHFWISYAKLSFWIRSTAFLFYLAFAIGVALSVFETNLFVINDFMIFGFGIVTFLIFNILFSKKI